MCIRDSLSPSWPAGAPPLDLGPSPLRLPEGAEVWVVETSPSASAADLDEETEEREALVRDPPPVPTTRR
eukprot:8564463-Alexandrium_andersonii.AAC.1